ncbi:MAG TPA: hypothetical protein VF178_03435 [Gemmatimonadaceae bacterium]
MSAFAPAWASVALLGALHGLNPAMGWLFAVSLGVQAQRSRAVWSALAPLALGHALAVAAALVVAATVGVVVSTTAVRWFVAASLLGVGVLHLRRHAHPSLGTAGMRVGPRQLTMWSFLVSSAHGAGLMVLPFVLRSQSSEGHQHAAAAGHSMHLSGIATTSIQSDALWATLLHTAGYLAVGGAIAWIVCERLGLRFLRRAWFNINVVWAAALIITAVVTPFV